ncbi:hypothetical protein TWF569_010192 [Orbilia oligospora]|uniref:Uncharacterized protein n=1 Tax=Orbilia oligospora TaxID=2813651 RepID=A0A7C8NEX3_ORBOL|nr:hypothetical protein TWF706_004263 [Orbilia oligospora]KAF3112827.1 hypothetical protein TWF102_004222 [Orbilia oligospora]KAF3134312.1 hypothetical protein TWF569_010192 [Orbilia oligospora]KAF3142737.1 hypothetical protein TWF703_000240 [Orbilia oligospora]KAF3151956.1 hypothetical protein TWF594_005713 [Orbilia oligospora]
MKYASKPKTRRASAPAMSYREFLKWQESFSDSTDSIRLHSKLRNIPIIRQSALPDPKNPRDWSFKPNGEAEIVRKWNRKKDQRKRVAVRIMKAFTILYRRDEQYDRVESFSDLRRKIRALYFKLRLLVWIMVIAPAVGALGTFYLYMIVMFNLCQIFRYVYWDWTLNPKLMHKPMSY